MARNNELARGAQLALRHNLAGITDKYIRDAIQEIHDYIHSHSILRGQFEKVSFTAPEAGTFRVDHCLPFIPCEIWLTSALGGNAVNINYDTINEDYFEITTTGAGEIKFLAGNIANFDTR